ncbi:MAG: hypothetical protein GY696_21290, partial [Gammaproteobacteria bacterium]|nr:hypothetical protein [Gammaproteobacteria bacterium]
LMTDSDDDNHSRPPTPKFETSTKPRVDEAPVTALTLAVATPDPVHKDKLASSSLFDSSDDETTTVQEKTEPERTRHLSAHERMKQSENLFDKLLTVNVDESVRLPKKSPGGSSTKSPGSAKSPGQRLSESQKSPGSHKSPLLSPGGKPTYLLAHAFLSRASKEAEKRHKEQEKELHKVKVADKKDSKADDATETKYVADDDNDEIKIVEERPAATAIGAIVSAETDSSNDIEIVSAEEKSPESVDKKEDDSDDVTMKSLSSDESSTAEAYPEAKLEQGSEKDKLAVTTESKVKDVTITEKKDTIPEATIIDPESDDDEGKLVIGEGDDGSDAEVVNMEDDTSKASPSTSTNSEEPEVIIEHVTNKETKIPDINVEDKPEVKEVKVSNDADKLTIDSKKLTDEVSISTNDVEQPKGKPVISQEEEIENAVNALLGESFDSFDTEDKGEVNNEVESMEVQESEPVDDEAAQAVAGLGISSPEDQSNDWIQPSAPAPIRTEKVADTKKDPVVEEKHLNVDAKAVKETEKDMAKVSVEPIDKPVVEEALPVEKPVEFETTGPTVTTRGKRGRNASARGGARGGAKNVGDHPEPEAAPVTAPSKPAVEESTRGGRVRGGRLGFGLTRGMARQEQPAMPENKIDVFEFDDDDSKTMQTQPAKVKELEKSPTVEPVKPAVVKGRKPLAAAPSAPAVSTPVVSTPAPVKPVIETETKPIAVTVQEPLSAVVVPPPISTVVAVPVKETIMVATTVSMPSKPIVVAPAPISNVTTPVINEAPLLVVNTKPNYIEVKPAITIVTTASPLVPITTASLTPIPLSTKSPEGIKPSRLRRSTGGRSRESEEEPADTEQEQKIKLILEQAKQEAAAEQAAAAQHLVSAGLTIHQAAALPVSLSSLTSQPTVCIPQQYQATAVVMATSPQQIQLKTGVPQPTVLPPRHDQQVRPHPQLTVAPIRPGNVMVPTSTLRPALPIQFPTKPLPPTSLRKTQPVLLEQNLPPAVTKNNTQSVVIPRSTIPISLPTEPIPRSVAMPVAGGSRLPMASMPITATKMTLATVATRMMTTTQSPGLVSAPRLPLSLNVVSNMYHMPHRMQTPISTLKSSSPITPVLTAVTKPTVIPVVSTIQLSTGPRVSQIHQQNFARNPIAVPRSSPSSEGLGLRVALRQREVAASEQEADKSNQQHPMALDLAASNQNALAKKEYLQPRDKELNRPSSTPVALPPHSEPMASPKEDEKLMYHPGMDQATLMRQILLSQLLQAGFPEQAALQHLPALLAEATAAKHNPLAGSQVAYQPHASHHEEDRRQPLPAHVSYRQTDSPLYHVPPSPAHSNIQTPYHSRDYGIPPTHHDIYGRPQADISSMVPPAAHSSQIKRLSHSAGGTDFSIRPTQVQQPQPIVEAEKPLPNVDLMTSYRMPHLAAYPICWTGILGLKNDMANVQMHFVSGCRDLALEYLPETGANMKIVQRMRLEDQQIEGVKKKMETKSEHCLLLALPHGNDQDQFETQSRILRNNFITYLQLKSAAGIANVTNKDNQPAIVHVFPSCDFANENLAR